MTSISPEGVGALRRNRTRWAAACGLFLATLVLTASSPIVGPLPDRVYVTRYDTVEELPPVVPFSDVVTAPGAVRRLYRDIVAMPPPPSGLQSCPESSGVGYSLVFTRPRITLLRASVGMGGCPIINLQGAGDVWVSIPTFWTTLQHALGLSQAQLYSSQDNPLNPLPAPHMWYAAAPCPAAWPAAECRRYRVSPPLVEEGSIYRTTDCYIGPGFGVLAVSVQGQGEILAPGQPLYHLLPYPAGTPTLTPVVGGSTGRAYFRTSKGWLGYLNLASDRFVFIRR